MLTTFAVVALAGILVFGIKLFLGILSYLFLGKLGCWIIDLYTKFERLFESRQYVQFENTCNNLINEERRSCILDDPFPEFSNPERRR